MNSENLNTVRGDICILYKRARLSFFKVWNGRYKHFGRICQECPSAGKGCLGLKFYPLKYGFVLLKDENLKQKRIL